MSTQTVEPHVSPSANLVQIGSIEEVIQQRLADERARLDVRPVCPSRLHHFQERARPSVVTKQERAFHHATVWRADLETRKAGAWCVGGAGFTRLGRCHANVRAFQLGKEYGNNGQCNPTYFTVGNLVQYLQTLEEQGLSKQEIIDNHVFFTAAPAARGRFGMYEAEYRLALRNAGFGVGLAQAADCWKQDRNIESGVAQRQPVFGSYMPKRQRAAGAGGEEHVVVDDLLLTETCSSSVCRYCTRLPTVK